MTPDYIEKSLEELFYKPLNIPLPDSKLSSEIPMQSYNGIFGKIRFVQHKALEEKIK
jgi:hypothetical protein